MKLQRRAVTTTLGTKQVSSISTYNSLNPCCPMNGPSWIWVMSVSSLGPKYEYIPVESCSSGHKIRRYVILVCGQVPQNATIFAINDDSLEEVDHVKELFPVCYFVTHIHLYKIRWSLPCFHSWHLKVSLEYRQLQ